jgi:hypothetical protein
VALLFEICFSKDLLLEGENWWRYCVRFWSYLPCLDRKFSMGVVLRLQQPVQKPKPTVNLGTWTRNSLELLWILPEDQETKRCKSLRNFFSQLLETTQCNSNS